MAREIDENKWIGIAAAVLFASMGSTFVFEYAFDYMTAKAAFENGYVQERNEWGTLVWVKGKEEQ